MSIIEDFDQVLTKPERQVMAQLTTPSRIQAFLDEFPYSVESNYCCPLRVFRERIAHCFDGALFVRIPTQIGHSFRSKPATYSDPNRPGIPIQTGHPLIRVSNAG